MAAETTTVSGVYAAALLQAAEDKNQLDAVRDEFEVVLDALTSDSTIFTFLRTPNIALNDKANVIKTVTGDKLSKTLVNFLMVVIRRGRQEALAEIYSDFLDLYRKAKNLLVVEVVSATKLDDQQKKRLQTTLEKKYGRGIVLNETIDQSLIGGLQILVEGDFTDSSVKFRLQQIRSRLGHTKVNSGDLYED